MAHQRVRAAVAAAETVDVEPSVAIPELNITQATKPGIELYATSSGRNPAPVTGNQPAPASKSTEKARFGSRITLFVLLGVALSILLAGILFEHGAVVEDWLTNTARIALDRNQTENAFEQDPVESAITQDPAKNTFRQDQAQVVPNLNRAEQAFKQGPGEKATSQAQDEIEVLKQDLASMQQKISDMQNERDAAVEKARLEKEKRESEKQAALDAAKRERDAQAAAALAAHKAQQATQKAEKLAIQQRLEKEQLAEQRERLKQANQQAESRRNLLEEQRKLLVSDWERLAEEKAKLESAAPEPGSE